MVAEAVSNLKYVEQPCGLFVENVHRFSCSSDRVQTFYQAIESCLLSSETASSNIHFASLSHYIFQSQWSNT